MTLIDRINLLIKEYWLKTISLPWNFFKIVVKRDFDPIRGQKSYAQHFFQCKLPIWGSWAVLFILCFIGILCLGFHGGIKAHLEQMEKNPFASAIRIEGAFKRKHLNNLKNKLFFNTDQKTLVIGQKDKKKEIPVIKAVYPFNQISLKFLDKSGVNIIKDDYDVLSVKVVNESQDEIKGHDSDLLIQDWIEKSLYKKDGYFKNNEGEKINNGIILSSSFFKELGYSNFNQNSKITIKFLSLGGKNNILEDRARAQKDIWAPLNDKEKIQYIVEIPLINVSDHLPGGDAIVTETFYNALTRGKFFNPCKSVEHFYINLLEPYDLNTQKIIEDWANRNFQLKYLRNLYFSSNKRFIKVQFTNISFDKNFIKTTSKCNILLKFENLKKRIASEISIDFKEDFPMEEEGNGNYYYAFLYIQKNAEIMNKINELSRFLRNEFNSYIEDHQVQTLKKYRKDMHTMNWILFGVFISIAMLMLIYIIVAFNLFLQTKLHNIGMMMSFGATSFIILWIYLFEALKLISYPLVLSAVFGIFIKYFFSNLLYAQSFFYILTFAISVIFVALSGAWLASKHIISQSPHRLISYKA